MSEHPNSFQSKSELTTDHGSYTYYSLPKAAAKLGMDLAKLPFSLKVLMENMLRYEDGATVQRGDVEAFAAWVENQHNAHDIA